MEISRRVLVAGAAAALLTPHTSRGASITSVGKIINTVSDGYLSLPISSRLAGLPQDEAMRLLAENGVSANQMMPECNLTLLKDGSRVVLFDAGAGPNFTPSTGRLGETLLAAGIEPTSVTDVIFTHAHPDHIWGILDDFDEITFPEARLHIGRTEWDFWRAEGVADLLPEDRKVFAVGAKNRFSAMEDRVELFDAGAEIVPGVEAVDTAGHTPGHMSFAIHAGDEYTMVVGDALMNHVFSFQRPDWPSGSDQDQENGAATRKRLLDRLASDGAPIIGFHLPDGGQGRVKRSGNAYRFVQDR